MHDMASVALDAKSATAFALRAAAHLRLSDYQAAAADTTKVKWLHISETSRVVLCYFFAPPTHTHTDTHTERERDTHTHTHTQRDTHT